MSTTNPLIDDARNRLADRLAGDPRRLASSAAGLVVVGALTASAGLPGAGAGAAVLAAWGLAGPVYAFALGQVAVAALSPASLLVLALAEVGLFGLLVVPALREAPRRTVGAFAVAGAGLIGVGAGVRDATGDLAVGVLAAVAAASLASYGLHRYELVSLDLVEADP